MVVEANRAEIRAQQSSGNSSGRAGRAVEMCPENNEPEEEPRVSIRASLFFDGTLNNRTNTSVGADNAPWGANLGSYDNDQSNIAKLETHLGNDRQADHSIKIYIEGIGTQNRGADIPISMGTGMGRAGINDKVRSGLRTLVSRIEGLGTNKRIDYIHLDVFGFSRGAAAARNFIYKSITDPDTRLMDRLTRLGYSVNSIEVIFTGLFETVASYGVAHYNDTSDLHLRSISLAQRVVQLGASDEHRENFRLTNINSAGNGLQIFLPGVHSDIGGGYVNNASESNLTIFEIPIQASNRARLEREKRWLIDMGWYRNNEITTTRDQVWQRDKIIVNRTGISNLYSRIPLQMMAGYAREKDMNFRGSLESGNSIQSDSFLVRVKAEIDRYVNGLGTFQRNGTTSTRNRSGSAHWFYLNNQLIKTLRHNYLHFSAHYDSIGHEPQFTGDNRMTGSRQRIIQDG